MAADALTSAAKARGDASLLVETQGTSDNSVLSEKEIVSADVVIFAADVGVRDHERFKGKRILECSPRQAIRDPNDTLSAAIALKNSSRNTTVRPHATHRVAATAYDLERKMRHAAMTGVSYMVPFVAAGGLLLALGFLLGGYDIAAGWQAIAIQHSFTDLPSHDVVIDIATGQSYHFSALAFCFILALWLLLSTQCQCNLLWLHFQDTLRLLSLDAQE